MNASNSHSNEIEAVKGSRSRPKRNDRFLQRYRCCVAAGIIMGFGALACLGEVEKSGDLAIVNSSDIVWEVELLVGYDIDGDGHVGPPPIG